MNETTKKVMVRVIVAAVFIISLILVIIGQKYVGASGLGIMLLGLAGLIALLWFYNKQYK